MDIYELVKGLASGVHVSLVSDMLVCLVSDMLECLESDVGEILNGLSAADFAGSIPLVFHCKGFENCTSECRIRRPDAYIMANPCLTKTTTWMTFSFPAHFYTSRSKKGKTYYIFMLLARETGPHYVTSTLCLKPQSCPKTQVLPSNRCPHTLPVWMSLMFDPWSSLYKMVREDS